MITSTEPTLDPAITLARQTLYRFASLCFLDPRAGSREQLADLRRSQLADAAAELVRHEPGMHSQAPARGERPVTELDPSRIFNRLPATADALNSEYERTFGLLVSNACPPYETEYISGKFTFQRSNALADIAGFYSAFGLRPAGHHPERVDHIVLELEFMARLLSLAAAAHERNDDEQIVVCHNAQRRFLQDHLCWWTPTFCRLLQLQSADTFYSEAAVFLSALIPAERALFDVPASSATPPPDAIERPEESDGCELVQLNG